MKGSKKSAQSVQLAKSPKKLKSKKGKGKKGSLMKGSKKSAQKSAKNPTGSAGADAARVQKAQSTGRKATKKAGGALALAGMDAGEALTLVQGMSSQLREMTRARYAPNERSLRFPMMSDIADFLPFLPHP
jgi:hypothetical protein